MSAATQINLVGVYSVGHDPWRLIELTLSDVNAPFDFGDFVIPDLTEPPSNWQVAWDERLLDKEGRRQLADSVAIQQDPNLLVGDSRICFFMYVISAASLRSPFGVVLLPPAIPLPERLMFVAFEEP